MIKFLEELNCLNTVTYLNKYFKLVFLREMSYINLAVIDLKLTLPLNGINDHVFIHLAFCLRLNMQFKNVGRGFLINNPQKEVQTLIVVFSVNRIRTRLDPLVTIFITIGCRLRP